MINYTKNVIYTHSNETSYVCMFIYLHHYEQQIEIPP
jgi:hypothetical protein